MATDPNGVVVFGFRLTRTGLRAADPKHPPTEEQYRHCGDYLIWMDGALQWLIGEWILYGEAHFGERASQVVDATGLKLDTVKQCVWVAERVPPARRDPDLSWSHHRAVADLAPAEQTRMLKKAKRDELSVAQLQQAINAEKHPEHTECWLLVSCKTPDDRERLIKQMESAGRSVKIP